MKVTLALCLAATASAFVPSTHTVSARARAAERTVTSMALEDMVGVGPETGNKVFDPAGLAKLGSDKTLAWYRACELKHGRVAMLATGGWMVQSLGVHFPGYISSSQKLKFEDLGTEPLAAFSKLPDAGKAQIITAILCVEIASELGKPHYTKGGDFVEFDPLGIAKTLTPEQLK